MATATFNIASNGDDSDGYYQNTAYPPQTAGTYTSRQGSTSYFVSRDFSSPNYATENVYLRWDTSSLPDNATVTAATLRIYVISKQNANSRNLTGDWYDFGGSPDTSADFADTGTSAFNSVTVASLTTSADNDITLSNVSSVSLTGVTGIRLHIDGGSPTGLNEVEIAGFEHASLTEARLIVTYTTPSAPSGQIQTTTSIFPWRNHEHAIVRATSRLWAAVVGRADATNPGVCLWYSDDDGGTWTKKGQLDSGTGTFGVSVAVNDETTPTDLYVAWGGGSSSDTSPLKFGHISSNVASGSPGAVTTTTIDAGGAGVGVVTPAVFVTKTASNARCWIVAQKQDSATPTWQTLAYYCLLTGVDTAGNWATTNFTNLDASSGSVNPQMGCGVYWTVSSADKATIALVQPNGGLPNKIRAFTFDPSAGTPTPGSAVDVASYTTSASNQIDTYGQLMHLNAKADYIVVGYYDPDTGTVTFRKSINGVSWSTPTGWSGLTMGRFQITLSGSDFFVVHAASYGDPATTVQNWQYRQITTSSDTMGGVTSFSSTQVNNVTVPRNTGTSKLYGAARGTTSSPYAIIATSTALGGAADTTPPGLATVTTSPGVSGGSVTVSAVMPSDSDVAQYEIRRLTTGYPATNRSDGTVIVSPTSTSANATVSFNDTGLTNGTRCYYRVFVKDTAGNWNTGQTATDVPCTLPTVVGWYDQGGSFHSDGVTGDINPIWEVSTASTDFESGIGATFRIRVGLDAPGANSPPTLSTIDFLSSTGAGDFKYESSPGVWTTIPVAGLPTSAFGKKVRWYSSLSGPAFYASMRIEQ